MNDVANPLLELQHTLYESKNPTRRRLHRARYAWVTQALADYAGRAPSSRGIEYGPGSGIYLPALARHFRQVVAADIEPAYLAGVAAVAAAIPGTSLMTDDIVHSRLPDRSFGFVLCSEVLEHVASPEAALATLYRILQPGGIAIVTTPQRYSVMELSCKVAFLPGVIQLVRHIYREPVLETGHISLRTGRCFRAVVDNCGFQVLRQEKFGLYVPLLAEFGGKTGSSLIEGLEERVRGTSLDWLLWTQAYVLQRPLAS